MFAFRDILSTEQLHNFKLAYGKSFKNYVSDFKSEHMVKFKNCVSDFNSEQLI